MFKILIVDDEKWIVEYIRAIIEKHNPDLEIIGQCHNGITALEIITASTPDIVITDIRMPGMDGLELVKATNMKNLNTKFIIISGFAEFEYAQTAINNGAVGYCLKPLKVDQLVHLLQKTVDALKNSALSKLNLLDVMDDLSNHHHSHISDFAKKYNVEFGKTKSIMPVTSVGGFLALPSDINFLSLKTGAKKWFYLIECQKPEDIKRLLVTIADHTPKSIGIGSRIEKTSEIHRAINETELSAFHFFINGIRKIYDITEVSRTSDIKSILVKLKEAMGSADTNLLESIFDMLEEVIDRKELNVYQTLYIFNSCMLLFKQKNESHDEVHYNYEMLVQNFENANHMLRYIKLQILQTIEQSDNFHYKELKNVTFKQILKYINRNYNQQISMQSVSQEFHLNISYLCQLFRKELGKTFTEYLNEIRINNACDLLKNSDASLDDISEKVGYNDYFYFNRIFKKLTGKPPKKYKNEAHTC